MGSTKTEKKTGGVLVRQEEIDFIVKTHRLIYDAFKTTNQRPSREAIEHRIEVLKEAEGILRSLSHYLCRDKDKDKVPKILPGLFKISPEWYRNVRLNATFEVLKETCDYLSKIPISAGRPINETIAGPAGCAAHLGSLFKEKTGDYHWEKVGEAVAKGFPEAVEQDDRGRDLRLWAYRLAQRRAKTPVEKRFAPLVWGLINQKAKNTPK